jgi:TRAP-type uncharacterized transport system fused permease subunit
VVLHLLLAVIVFGDLGPRANGSSWACSPWAWHRAGRLEAGGITGPHPPVLVEAFETGAKYALAVGAAAATVGIVIGVVTLTGVGFKLSYIITGWATAMAGGWAGGAPAGWPARKASRCWRPGDDGRWCAS